MTRKLLLLLAPLCLIATACLPTVDVSNDEPGSSSESSSESTGTDLGIDVPEFLDLVLVYEWKWEFNLGITLNDYAIVRFDDGTYSNDLRTILASGIDTSKAESPGRWGLWDGTPNDSSFTLTNSEGKNALDLEASLSSDSIPSDMKLDRCYKSLKAIGLASTELGETGTALSSKEFCFQSNGVFTTSSSGSTLTPEMVGSSRSADAGLYQIDGNVIRLTFGNGTQNVHFFGVYGDPNPQTVVSLNSSALSYRSE